VKKKTDSEVFTTFFVCVCRYQKTSSAVKTASEKTNETVRNVASSVSKKLGDFRLVGISE
jgi:hypothetical protein